MKSKKIRNRTVGLLLSSLTTLSLTGTSVILAEDLVETDYSFTEAVSSVANSINLTVNGDSESPTQLLPSESFPVSAKVRISSDILKSQINNLLQLPSDANPIVNNQATVSGLHTLSGQLAITLTSTRPLKSFDERAVSFSNSKYISNPNISLHYTNGQVTGLEVTATINWGDLLRNYTFSEDKANLDLFKSNSNSFFAELQISTPELSFEVEPDVPTSITLNATTNYSFDGGQVEIQYYKKDKNPYSAGTLTPHQVTIPANNNLGYLTSSHGLQIVYKKTSSTHRPSSPQKPSKPTVNPGGDANEKVIVNRLYNPKTGEHLFTPNEAERTVLVASGWKYESNDWDTLRNSDHPIYRLYNPNNGDHHYTTSAPEKDQLVEYGWKYEGISLYSANSEDGIPVYRMYNPNATGAGSHHYTNSTKECEALRKLGWNFEGIAWYGILR